MENKLRPTHVVKDMTPSGFTAKIQGDICGRLVQTLVGTPNQGRDETLVIVNTYKQRAKGAVRPWRKTTRDRSHLI